eukprot:6775275-Pyramimonas_sp.AAC.1
MPRRGVGARSHGSVAHAVGSAEMRWPRQQRRPAPSSTFPGGSSCSARSGVNVFQRGDPPAL